MYRLSGVEDMVLQQIVSNEIAAGFLKTFGVKRAVNKLEFGDREKEILKYLNHNMKQLKNNLII